MGMSLLFLMLVFLYGLLSLMTAVLKESPRISASSGGENTKSADEQATIQAAAIAVAMARAQAEQGSGFLSKPAEDLAAGARLVSPWWALHHQRQLTLNPNTRRIR